MKWLGIMFMAVLLASAPGYGSAQQPKDTSPATQTQGPEVKGETAGMDDSGNVKMKISRLKLGKGLKGINLVTGSQ